MDIANACRRPFRVVGLTGDDGTKPGKTIRQISELGIPTAEFPPGARFLTRKHPSGR